MRKEKAVVVPLKGRDLNKTFLLREMPASEGEEWAMRALLALARSGVEVPDDFMSSGLAGMAIVGLKALGGLDYDVAKPLFQKMMDCVQIIPDTTRPAVTRPLIEDDIEEISTRLWLRKEVFGLHVDFFTDAGLWAQAREVLGTAGNSSPIQTSPVQ